jgi:hypothetical protein
MPFFRQVWQIPLEHKILQELISLAEIRNAASVALNPLANFPIF